MTTEIQQDIIKSLGLDLMAETERDAFLERIGTMAIESALLRFVTTLDRTERSVFDSWLAEQEDLNDLLENAAQRYPMLATILDEEVTAMQESIGAMVR
jgi:hypothetical protein